MTGLSQTLITCGQTVASNTTSPSQIVQYSYNGTAGQMLSFALFWGCCAGTEAADIYNPSGQWVTNVTAGNGGNAIALTLPSSGIYTILVHNVGYGNAGGYALSVQSLTDGGCGGTNLLCGGTINSNIVGHAEVDAIAVPGGAGAAAIFSFSGFGGMEFDLYDPTGNRVFTCGPGAATNITFAISGTHTLLVHDSAYTTTGGYGVSLTCFGCANTISPTSVSVGPAATNGTVTVTTSAGCNWTATTNTAWLSISGGASGLGNGMANYLVAANLSTNQRVGTITIGHWTFTVNQAGETNLFDTDIGIPGAAGSLGVTNGVYTVRGSGQGIFTTGDVFNFAYLPMQGDGMIVARLAGMQPDNLQSEAGVMMRDGLSSGARHVFLGLDASTNMFLRRRLVADANSIENVGPGTNVSWLRLTRIGNIFVGHVSTNGTTWNYAWATALELPSQLDVGLAVTSHHYAYTNTAEFDNLVIGPATPLPGAWPWSAPRMYLCLDTGTLAAMQNLGGFPVLAGGVVGDQFSIKCSTNAAASLASWPSLGMVTNTWGVATFVDSQALTNRMRFYRVQRTGP
jgi:hypothetical protein